MKGSRQISLGELTVLEFRGNPYNQSLLLGNIDNDRHGDIEFAAGGVNGTLCIYKGPSLWKRVKDLGTITSLALGDVWGEGNNVLVVVTAEGQCLLLEFSPPQRTPDFGNFTLKVDEESHGSSPSAAPLSPSEGTSTILSALSSSLHAAGPPEIQLPPAAAAAATTRPHRGHSGSEQGTMHSPRSPPPPMRSPFLRGRRSAPVDVALSSIPHFAYSIPLNISVALVADLNGDGHNELYLGSNDRKVLVFQFTRKRHAGTGTNTVSVERVATYPMPEQVRSLSIHTDSTDGSRYLLVGLQVGHFLMIDCTKKNLDEALRNQWWRPGADADDVHSVSMEVLGDVRSATGETLIATTSLNGALALWSKEKRVMSMQMKEQLFAIAAVDLTNDGAHELAVCSWDGHTYITDQEENVVRFDVGSRVAAFTSGTYTVDPFQHISVPCFFFINFQHQILVFRYVSRVRTIGATTLLSLARKKLTERGDHTLATASDDTLRVALTRALEESDARATRTRRATML